MFISYQALWIVGIMIVMPDRAVLPQQPHHRRQADDGHRHQSDGRQPVRRQRHGWSLLSFVISAAIGAIGGVAISSYVGGITYARRHVRHDGLHRGRARRLGLELRRRRRRPRPRHRPGAVHGFVPAGYKNVVAFIILLIVLYFRPQGLLGTNVPEGEV